MAHQSGKLDNWLRADTSVARTVGHAGPRIEAVPLDASHPCISPTTVCIGPIKDK